MVVSGPYSFVLVAPDLGFTRSPPPLPLCVGIPILKILLNAGATHGGCIFLLFSSCKPVAYRDGSVMGEQLLI